MGKGKTRGARVRSAFVLAGVFLSFMTAGLACADDVTSDYNLSGPGLLGVASQAPSQTFRFTPMPSIPDAVHPGKVDLRFGSSWVNVWSKDARYLLDYESLNSRISLAYGVNERLQLSAAFEGRNYFGGAMDNLIEGFHDLFNLYQDGRDRTPGNQTRILIRDAAGDVTYDSSDVNQLDNSSFQLSVSYLLFRGTKILPAVSLSGTLAQSVQSPLAGNGEPLDFSGGIGLSKRWAKRWYSYHTLSYTHFDQTQMAMFSMEDNGMTLTNTLAWQVRPTVALILQAMYSEGLVKDLPGLKDASQEVHMGFKWRPTKAGVLEFALIENVINYDNGPDFGVHLSYTWAPKGL